MRIFDICTRRVIGITPTSSVAEAALAMAHHQVGAVVVMEQCDGRDIPLGILTDRDIALAVVAEHRDPVRVPVAEVMSCSIVTCRDDADLVTVSRMMRGRGARRLPVMNAREQLVGLVTAHDVLNALSEELCALTRTRVDDSRDPASKSQ